MKSDGTALRRSRELTTLVPYVVLSLGWFAFLMVASRVRMNEPVFLWVMTQGLLKSKFGLGPGYWSSVAFFLGMYLLIGCVVWWVVEREGRDPRHTWRRAFVAWICAWAAYAVLATLLVQTGVLHV
jgi:hypothetical protein